MRNREDYTLTSAEILLGDRPPRWLKVRDGCYVRVRDISMLGLGMQDRESGAEMAGEDTIIVGMTNGAIAAFDPSPSVEDALTRLTELARLLGACGE